jgi:hypothetical protein
MNKMRNDQGLSWDIRTCRWNPTFIGQTSDGPLMGPFASSPLSLRSCSFYYRCRPASASSLALLPRSSRLTPYNYIRFVASTRSDLSSASSGRPPSEINARALRQPLAQSRDTAVLTRNQFMPVLDRANAPLPIVMVEPRLRRAGTRHMGNHVL